MIFDKWQQEIIEHQGSVTIRKGRQVGGSTAIGNRAAKLMMKYSKSNSLMIAPAQRQSSELFIKTMSWLMIEHNKSIDAAGGYKDDPMASARRNMELRRVFENKHGIFAEIPTKTVVKLKTGSILYSLPAGKTGVYLRSFALDFLYVDEAAYVPDPVYNALKPMLLVSKKKNGLGWEVFLSTPFGRGGFFYDSFTDDDYKQFHISSEDCKRIDKADLLKEQKKISKIQYAQEYLGEFIDEFQQMFPTALIKKCMTFIRWDHNTDHKPGKSYFIGVDVARYGEDESAFVIAEMRDRRSLKIVKVEVSEKQSIPDTTRKIERLHKVFKFNKIFIDDGGIGCGVFDTLHEEFGRIVIGLNNAKKSYDHEGERTNKILKEDYTLTHWS